MTTFGVLTSHFIYLLPLKEATANATLELCEYNSSNFQTIKCFFKKNMPLGGYASLLL